MDTILKCDMKSLFIRLFACICYYLGIVKIFYRLNKRSKRIITFHNVIPENLLPKGKRIGIIDTDNEFRFIVEQIKRQFEIDNDISNPCSAMITFDDGYLNQKVVVEPILKELGDVKPIIFLSGRLFNNNNPHEALVVDLLMHWVELVPDGDYYLPGNLYSNANFTIKENRRRIWQEIIWPAFIRDNETKGDTILKILDSQYPMSEIFKSCDSEYLKLRMTGICDADIDALTDNGWYIGWHTFSHYPLSRLSMEQQMDEIAKSPQFTKDIPFSYPYGELESVNNTSLDCVKRSGYSCAVSNLPEVNSLTCRWFIPRYTLSANKYLLHFELSGLKYFIKCHKLLPRLNVIV